MSHEKPTVDVHKNETYKAGIGLNQVCERCGLAFVPRLHTLFIAILSECLSKGRQAQFMDI